MPDCRVNGAAQKTIVFDVLGQQTRGEVAFPMPASMSTKSPIHALN